jgi:MSHA biogenesis protein MshJ
MKRYWFQAQTRIDAMSVRERVMIFAATAFMLIAALNALFLDPLLAKQKLKLAEVVQQQEKLKELQAARQALMQAKVNDDHSPLRSQIAELKQQLQEHDRYLQSRKDKLVSPDKMSALLEQVLKNNDKLELLELKTLPLSLLIEPLAGKAAAAPAQQIYKHGVQITVRGGYLELMRYLSMLEKLPTQMFWGDVTLTVEKHPDSVMILTVYTLSMDKTWLTV